MTGNTDWFNRFNCWINIKISINIEQTRTLWCVMSPSCISHLPAYFFFSPVPFRFNLFRFWATSTEGDIRICNGRKWCQLFQENFEESLKESLDSWKSKKIRGIWVKVPLVVGIFWWFIILRQDSEFVPILVRHGFSYHHAQKDFVMLTKWLPEELSTLPLYAHTQIGVGGLVEDGNGRILMMREKRGQ